MATDVFFILSATLNCFIVYGCLEACKHRVDMSVNSYFVMVLYQCDLIWFLIGSLKLITLIQSSKFQTTASSHSAALHSMLPSLYCFLFFLVELVVFYWPACCKMMLLDATAMSENIPFCDLFQSIRHWWYLENYSVFMSVFWALIHWFLP